eukprot:96042-Ditylum_brightwellii.AAC.1
MRLYPSNSTLLNSDAEACYNQMIPGVMALHSQSLGLPDSATKCNGVSENSYGHTKKFGNWGEGQRKAALPSNWQFQSSTMLSALMTLYVSTGLYLMSTCKYFIANRIDKACVDDATNESIDQHTQHIDTPASMAQKMTKIAQTWEQLLFVSGSKISIKKSC